MIDANNITKAALRIQETANEVSLLLGRPVSLHFRFEDGQQITEELIERTVSGVTGIGPKEIHGDSRNVEVTIARYICWKLMNKYMKSTYVDIGRHYGGRNHSTVISGLRKLEDEIATDKNVRKAFEDCESLLVTRIS